MNVYKLTETLAVSGQILPEHIPQIAEAGFKVIINNRPDGEEPGQPSSADIAAAAEQAGLEYHHFPVNGMSFPGPHADEMADLFDDEQRPVYAFCRTGTRCSNLWVLTRSETEEDAAAAHARGLGFDLSLAAAHGGA